MTLFWKISSWQNSWKILQWINTYDPSSNFISNKCCLGRNLKTKKRHHVNPVGKKSEFTVEGDSEHCFCQEWFFTWVHLWAFWLRPCSLRPLHTLTWKTVSLSLLFTWILLLSVCVFIFYGILQNAFSVGFVLFAQSLPTMCDHALAGFWGCPDGKNVVIAFSEWGLILSYFFTTWACQDRVYPQKLIAYLLHHISQSICITKGKVGFFSPTHHKLGNKLPVLLLFITISFIGREKIIAFLPLSCTRPELLWVFKNTGEMA